MFSFRRLLYSIFEQPTRHLHLSVCSLCLFACNDNVEKENIYNGCRSRTNAAAEAPYDCARPIALSFMPNCGLK